MLNNGIIGSDASGNGISANNHLRVFSEGPEDSPSRSLARYPKEIAERYMPGMTVDLIFRHDRFGPGGDRTSFVAQGFAAIRLTTPSENYANRHTATDTFANASVPYTTRVAKMNAATLALAPKPPVVSVPRPAGGRGAGRGPDTAAAGDPAGSRGGRGGPPGPGLSRGKGYDAVARWAMPNPEPDIAGYSLLIRDTPAPLWRREIYVGNVTEYIMPDTSIDDIVVGCAPSIRTEIQAWCRPMRWRPRG